MRCMLRMPGLKAICVVRARRAWHDIHFGRGALGAFFASGASASPRSDALLALSSSASGIAEKLAKGEGVVVKLWEPQPAWTPPQGPLLPGRHNLERGWPFWAPARSPVVQCTL